MDFIEEHTPQGIAIKILFKKWQFLAFDKKGKSIYADSEGRSLLHKVPLLLFIGNTFSIIKEHDQAYTLLKVRNKSALIPYKDLKDKLKKYIFISYNKKIDLLPVRMFFVRNITAMVKEIDNSSNPDYIIIDESVTENDIVIIKNRFKVADDTIIYLDRVNNYRLAEENKPVHEEKIINLNMLSANPVYLSRIHLRNMDLSKVNQLLLDFDLTALDSEYIMNFIDNLLKKEDQNQVVRKNKKMLLDLRDAFRFYLFLLQRSDDDIRNMINSITETKKLTPYRTLISKVRSLHPGNEEQILYTEYENIVADKTEELLAQGLMPEENEVQPDELIEFDDAAEDKENLELIRDEADGITKDLADNEKINTIDETVSIEENPEDLDFDLEISEDDETVIKKTDE